MEGSGTVQIITGMDPVPDPGGPKPYCYLPTILIFFFKLLFQSINLNTMTA
jgi:hypothetical protein